jgi:hypothetical protein
MPTLRLGAGAGYAGDRIDPAVDLAASGQVDHLVFECLAERTIALAHLAKRRDPRQGFGQLLHERMAAVLPHALGSDLTIVTNLGAANPLAALEETRKVAADLGAGHLTLAAITGDDVLDRLHGSEAIVWETGRPVHELGERLVAANAYLGVEAVLPALRAGARVVLGGRLADPSLFLAPLVHRFGWDLDDWDRLGAGTVVAHLLECSAQVTGGYFADPGVKDVEELVDVGFPIAEVQPDGSAVITKLPGTGGEVSLRTCKEQLLYEVGDPTRYLTPDVAADLSQVTFEQVGPDRVAVRGGRGRRRPDQLKVTLGVEAGYLGEGQISYAGRGAAQRAELAATIIEERLARQGLPASALRTELIGRDATLQGWAVPPDGPLFDVRLRVVGRADDERTAARIGREVEALYLNGPAGGAGATTRVEPIIAARSTAIDRSLVEVRTHLEGGG